MTKLTKIHVQAISKEGMIALQNEVTDQKTRYVHVVISMACKSSKSWEMSDRRKFDTVWIVLQISHKFPTPYWIDLGYHALTTTPGTIQAH